MSSPRTRPLRADARRNRERVLNAAGELFASDGLAVAIDEIAARAGVGPGTVHRHFPTKQALVAAVVISRVEHLTAHARSLANAADPAQALRQAITGMLDEGAHSTPLKAALAGTDFDLRTSAPGAASDLRRAVAVLLDNAQAAGAVRPDIGIDDLMALVAGAFATLQHAGAEADRGRAARLNTVLFNGLRVP